jgi:trimeric autotransporter adhesin
VRQFSSSDSFESVVAGNGGNGYGGDAGPGTAAELAGAVALAVDSSGNLVLVDSENCRIRVVVYSSGTFYGQAMTAGHIYTVAGDGKFGFSGDGGPATSAELSFPQALAEQKRLRCHYLVGAAGFLQRPAVARGGGPELVSP